VPRARRRRSTVQLGVLELESRCVPAIFTNPSDYIMPENSFFSTTALTGVLSGDSSNLGVFSDLVAHYVPGSLSGGTLIVAPNGLVLQGNGSFTFEPPAGVTGTFTFQYFVTQDVDGQHDQSGNVTVTIQVVPQDAMTAETVVPPGIGWTGFSGDTATPAGIPAGTPGGPGRTRATVTPGRPAPVTTELWSNSMPTGDAGSPIIVPAGPEGNPEEVVVGDGGGNLNAFTTAFPGTKLWSVQIGDGSFQYGQAPAAGLIITPSGLATEAIFVGSAAGNVQALDAATGADIWKFPDLALPNPLTANGTQFLASPLLVPGVPNAVVATGTPVGVPPAPGETTGLIVEGSQESGLPGETGNIGGVVRAFNPDGTVEWTDLFPGRVIWGGSYAAPGTPGAADSPGGFGYIYVVCENAYDPSSGSQLVSHVYRLDPETGMVLAEYPIPGVSLVPVNGISGAPITDPVTGNTYFAYNNDLAQIAPPDPATGLPGSMAMLPNLTFFVAGGELNSTPAIAPAALGALAGDLYIGDSNGNFYCLAPTVPTATVVWQVGLGSSNQIWDSPALDVYFPAGPSGPAAGVVYFGTKSGLVEGLDAGTGATVFSYQDPQDSPINYNSPAIDGAGDLFFGNSGTLQHWA
jgi:outer membrane protein assembly factor BamB